MAKYFYRTSCTSSLGKQIRLYLHDCDKAEVAAEIFAKKIGAEAYYPSPMSFAGGVSYVTFPQGKKVNEKIWKKQKEQDADGADVYVPDVIHRRGALLLPRKDFRPSDTAYRIYDKRNCRWQDVRDLYKMTDWAGMIGMRLTDDKQKDAELLDERMSKELFRMFTELSRPGIVITSDGRYKIPLIDREAIRIEHDRMRLPEVNANRLFRLLNIDFMDGQDNGMKIVQPVAPAFFEWADRYYIGSSYPCNHDDLETITQGTFNLKRTALRQAEEVIRRGDES